MACDALRRSSSVEGLRVLVADDDENIRLIVGVVLRSRGLEVVFARDGWEAILLFSEDPFKYQLVLLDLVMPVVSGRDVLRTIAAIEPRTRVLLMTGTSPDSIPEVLAHPCVRGLLPKPFSIGQLAGRVFEAIDAPVPEPVSQADARTHTASEVHTTSMRDKNSPSAANRSQVIA